MDKQPPQKQKVHVELFLKKERLKTLSDEQLAPARGGGGGITYGILSIGRGSDSLNRP